MQISKLSVLLTASAGGFVSTFNSAGKTVDGFKSSFEHAAGGIAAIGAAIGAGEAVEGMAELVKHSFEAIDATAKLSDTLGIATEKLGALQYAASFSGTSNDALTAGLLKMQRSLTGAEEDGGKAAEAFQRLGLSTDELLKLPTEQQLGKIADALMKVQNPTLRNGEAMAIFGRGAAQLMPLLSEGSEGLGKFAAEAEKAGFSVSRMDANKIEQANDAIQRMHNVLEGAINKLTIQMAPFITDLANRLSNFALQGEGLSGALVNGFEAVVRGIAGVADYLELAKSGFHALKGVALYEMYAIVEVIALVLRGLDWLAQKLGMQKTAWGDAFEAGAQSIKHDAADAFKQAGQDFDKFASGANAAKATRFFDSIRSSSAQAARATAAAHQQLGGFAAGLDAGGKSAEKVKAKLDDLQKQLDQFNMTRGMKVADDVKRDGGSLLDQLKAFWKGTQLEALDAAKKKQDDLASSAQQLWDETRTPLEQYNAELDKLNKLQAAGLLKGDTYTRGLQKAADDLAKAGDHHKEEDKHEPSKLITAGSADAASFVAKMQAEARGGGSSDPQVQVVKGQEKANGILGDILDAIKGGSGAALAVADFA